MFFEERGKRKQESDSRKEVRRERKRDRKENG
jgi:hypothetical protein